MPPKMRIKMRFLSRSLVILIAIPQLIIGIICIHQVENEVKRAQDLLSMIETVRLHPTVNHFQISMEKTEIIPLMIFGFLGFFAIFPFYPHIFLVLLMMLAQVAMLSFPIFRISEIRESLQDDYKYIIPASEFDSSKFRISKSMEKSKSIYTSLLKSTSQKKLEDIKIVQKLYTNSFRMLFEILNFNEVFVYIAIGYTVFSIGVLMVFAIIHKPKTEKKPKPAESEGTGDY
ncbi:unnamed protein product [Caenorhabditis angaria]|uniref:Uncharacterized protein n=1 Tax=Caenorhabditis angaria TaxID=860376 RepID=A0A9P1N0B7_9PELO|nr:unnamed protein product [Caenorhabditis angaria]